MEISGILPVQMGGESSRSLNDDFAATTPSGDSVFGKPLGAKCTWKTAAGGCISVSFMFDPKQKYSRSHGFASTITDCFGEFREQITKHLLDEKDIAPKTKTLEETIWETITSTLPKETLAKNVFNQPDKLKEYMDILKASTTATFNEETLLTEKLQNSKYSFGYQVAIDAYPQQIRGKKLPPGEKVGVLTLHIQGMLAGTEECEAALAGKSSKKATSASANSTQVEKSKLKREASGDAPQQTKKRKMNSDGEDELSNKEQLLQDLGLTQELAGCVIISDKEYPLTATQFFEAMGRWFSTTVSNLASKLEKDRNRNPLYQ